MVDNAKMDAWLGDLATTNVPQAKGTLFDGRGYCCLGRADEVCFGARFEDSDLVEAWGDGFRALYHDDAGASILLVSEREKQLGLDAELTHAEYARLRHLSLCVSGDGFRVFPGETRQETLSALNDHGFTFRQIRNLVVNLGWNR